MRSLLLIMSISSLAFAATYRQVAGLSETIQRVEDSVFIPADPANRDYADYLAWVKQGNRILPPLPPSSDEVANKLAKEKALTDVKDSKKTDAEKIDALLTIIGVK